MLGAVKRICCAEAHASAAPRDPHFTTLSSYPLTDNDPEATQRVAAAFRAQFGDRVYQSKPAAASEDFSVFGRTWQVPYVFWFVGGTDPETYEKVRAAGTVAMAAYALFGLGLAFYATPSTGAALANLPTAQSGSGSGIYKIASSLGVAMGVAISGAIFASLGADDGGVRWLDGVITFSGRQDNLALREAAMVALGFNLVMVLVAIASIMLTIPKGKAVQAD